MREVFLTVRENYLQKLNVSINVTQLPMLVAANPPSCFAEKMENISHIFTVKLVISIILLIQLLNRNSKLEIKLLIFSE